MNGNDIIDAVISAYKKYECPKDMDCQNKHPEFWIQCLKTGITELEYDLTEDNIKKELADIVMIGIDALHKLGYDSRQVIFERLMVNMRKDMKDRDIDFYRNKELRLRGYKQ